MRRIIAAAAAIVMLIGGCSVINESKERGRYIPASELDMSGLGYSGRVEKLAVYFYNAANAALTAEIRTVVVEQDANPAESAVKELLKGPSNTELLEHVAPQGMELEHIEYSRDVANVYVTYDGLLVPREKFILELAIANTVTDILGTEYTSVFYNGLQQGFINDIQYELPPVPYAPLQKHTGSVEDAWLQTSVKNTEVIAFPKQVLPEEEEPEEPKPQDPFEQPEVRKNEITTVLYYMSADGGFILPEVRPVEYIDGRYIEGIIAELGKRPQNTGIMTNPLAEGIQLLEEPALERGENGAYALRLNLSKLPTRYDYSSSEETQLSYAAMVYTITGFMPGIESIDIYVNGIKISAEGSGSGVMNRSDFNGFIGSSAPLYFADKNSDLLLEISRSMEQGKTWSAKARILELLKGPLTGDEEGTWPVMPTGISDSDIISVDVYSDTAYVNLSEEFKEACIGFSSKNEMLLVYAVVNTITAMDGISKVQFLIEGQQTDTLAGYLCLSGPFIKNYGIIKQSG